MLGVSRMAGVRCVWAGGRSWSRASVLSGGNSKRKMGDWFKPNYWVEEWNSRRETTEFQFEYNETTIGWIVLCYVLIPLGIHHVIKYEFEHPNTNMLSKKQREVYKL